MKVSFTITTHIPEVMGYPEDWVTHTYEGEVQGYVPTFLSGTQAIIKCNDGKIRQVSISDLKIL